MLFSSPIENFIQYFRFRRQLFLYSFFKELKCYKFGRLRKGCAQGIGEDRQISAEIGVAE